MTIDLHVHSAVSDGSMPPADLVALAARKGLSAIALTDHDTVAGIDAAVSAGRFYGVEIVTGVELSVRYSESSVHLLGYLFNHNDRILLSALERLQEGRIERNKEIISRLKNHGVDIHYGELQQISGSGECGRPHIAKLLIQKKVVKSMEEAFEKFLKQGTPTYVSRFIYDAGEAIDVLKSAGGLAVLAHPPSAGQNGGSIGDNLADLVKMGLDGIEVYYPTHSKKFRKQLMAFAKQRNLLITGGSDYHGDIRPGTTLAGGNNVSVPAELLVRMKQKAAESRRGRGMQ